MNFSNELNEEINIIGFKKPIPIKPQNKFFKIEDVDTEKARKIISRNCKYSQNEVDKIISDLLQKFKSQQIPNYIPLFPNTKDNFIGEGGSAQASYACRVCLNKKGVQKLQIVCCLSISRDDDFNRLEESSKITEDLAKKSNLFPSGVLPIIEMKRSFSLLVKHKVYVKLCEGDLAKYIKDYGDQLSIQEKVSIFVKAGESIANLHDNNIIHRDIKLDNILFRKGKNNKFQIFIGDLEFVMDITKPDSEVCGTPPYLAPEVAKVNPLFFQENPKKSPYNLKTEAWAFGVSLLQAFITEENREYIQNMTQPDANILMQICQKVEDPEIKSLLLDHIFVEEKGRWTVKECVAFLKDSQRSWTGYDEIQRMEEKKQ